MSTKSTLRNGSVVIVLSVALTATAAIAQELEISGEPAYTLPDEIRGVPVRVKATHVGFKGLKYKAVPKELKRGKCLRQKWKREYLPSDGPLRYGKWRKDGAPVVSNWCKAGSGEYWSVAEMKKKEIFGSASVYFKPKNYVPFARRDDLKSREYDENVPESLLGPTQRTCITDAMSAWYAASGGEAGSRVLSEILPLARIRVEMKDNRLGRKKDSDLKYGLELGPKGRGGKRSLTLKVIRNSKGECRFASSEQVEGALRKWAFLENPVVAAGIYGSANSAANHASRGANASGSAGRSAVQ